MAKKKAFLLYTDMRERMSKLKNEEAGVLFKAILDYAADGKPIATDNRLLEYAFSEVKQQLDRDAEKYETIKSKRAEAGAEGARKRWEKARTAEKSMTDTNRNNDAPQETEKANAAASEDAKSDVPEGYEKFSFEFVSAVYKVAFFKWLNYKRERREKYKGQSSLEAAYKRLIDCCHGDSAKAAVVVENSMANNWAGLFELNESGQQGKSHRPGDYTTMQVKQDYPKWEKR